MGLPAKRNSKYLLAIRHIILIIFSAEYLNNFD